MKPYIDQLNDTIDMLSRDKIAPRVNEIVDKILKFTPDKEAKAVRDTGEQFIAVYDKIRNKLVKSRDVIDGADTSSLVFARFSAHLESTSNWYADKLFDNVSKDVTSKAGAKSALKVFKSGLDESSHLQTELTTNAEFVEGIITSGNELDNEDWDEAAYYIDMVEDSYRELFSGVVANDIELNVQDTYSDAALGYIFKHGYMFTLSGDNDPVSVFLNIFCSSGEYYDDMLEECDEREAQRMVLRRIEDARDKFYDEVNDWHDVAKKAMLQRVKDISAMYRISEDEEKQIEQYVDKVDRSSRAAAVHEVDSMTYDDLRDVLRETN